MAGKPTSGNFTQRRGRKLRRSIRLDDDTSRRLRELHNLTMIPEEQIVRLLILHASGETLDQVQAEVRRLGGGLFVCAYHFEIAETTETEGSYPRPNCPTCGRPMRHVLSELP